MRILILALMAMLLSLPARAQDEVHFWHALRGTRGEALQRLVEDFNRTHPGLKVVAEFKGAEQPGANDYAALNRALLESLPLGQPPELQPGSHWCQAGLGAGVERKPVGHVRTARRRQDDAQVDPLCTVS